MEYDGFKVLYASNWSLGKPEEEYSSRYIVSLRQRSWRPFSTHEEIHRPEGNFLAHGNYDFETLEEAIIDLENRVIKRNSIFKYGSCSHIPLFEEVI